MNLQMRELLNTIPQTGAVQWIGIRPSKRAEIQVVSDVHIHEDGLEGDHFGGKAGAPRTVTIIQQEHIVAMASILQKESIDPSLLRRNIVVSGINLQSLKEKRFTVGEATLFATGNCAPCSRMEENLGAGGYNAMRGHGGITARVVVPGKVCVGDKVNLDLDSS